MEKVQLLLVCAGSLITLLSILANAVQLVSDKKNKQALALLGTKLKELNIDEKTKSSIKAMAEKLGIEKKLNKVYTKLIKNDVFKKLLQTKDIWVG